MSISMHHIAFSPGPMYVISHESLLYFHNLSFINDCFNSTVTVDCSLLVTSSLCKNKNEPWVGLGLEEREIKMRLKTQKITIFGLNWHFWAVSASLSTLFIKDCIHFLMRVFLYQKRTYKPNLRVKKTFDRYFLEDRKPNQLIHAVHDIFNPH